uniref:Angiopoietin-related protein 2 n=1 Tax=Magallana gigas TaxID=29159 RepID=K1R714_MAGGI
MIKEIVEREQKYVLTQPHETATSEVCVLKEVFVRNGSSAKIQCGAECNKDETACVLFPWQQGGRSHHSAITASIIGRYAVFIIQRRLDGSVNFRRNWREYEDGFGTFDSEFWIGNKNLHYLTSDGLTYLRVEMMMQTCEWRYADYGQFIVKSATDKYRLFVANYSGNAGDSFYYHNNAQFSTYDYDHDTSYSNCADRCKGGWWYTKCHLVNLNGEYANTNFLEGINWHAMTGFTYSLKEVRMMLRRP